GSGLTIALFRRSAGTPGGGAQPCPDRGIAAAARKPCAPGAGGGAKLSRVAQSLIAAQPHDFPPGELKGTSMVNADLLKGLEQSAADGVLALGNRMLLTTGAQLFHLGDEAESIYLVTRGRLRLTLPMQVRNREED